MTAEDGIVWYLRVAEEDLGPVLVLVVEGRISGATAGHLDRALARRDAARLRGIVLDLSGVDYINSAGLRLFEAAAARMRRGHCELVICGLRPIVRAAFELAGLIGQLAMEASREVAVARLRGGTRFTRSAHL